MAVNFLNHTMDFGFLANDPLAQKPPDKIASNQHLDSFDFNKSPERPAIPQSSASFPGPSGNPTSRIDYSRIPTTLAIRSQTVANLRQFSQPIAPINSQNFLPGQRQQQSRVFQQTPFGQPVASTRFQDFTPVQPQYQPQVFRQSPSGIPGAHIRTSSLGSLAYPPISQRQATSSERRRTFPAWLPEELARQSQKLGILSPGIPLPQARAQIPSGNHFSQAPAQNSRTRVPLPTVTNSPNYLGATAATNLQATPTNTTGTNFNMFSEPGTPLFSSTQRYDNGFGTPMFPDDKLDYFGSGAGKINTDFASATSMFNNSPYPQTGITPPDSADDVPSWGPYGNNVPTESIESAFDQGMASNFDSNTIKMQFGQTTPPDEKARSESMEELQAAFQQDSETIVVAPPAKTSKKRSKKDIKVEDGNEDDGSDTKRNKFLERNRIAASKCRQKKKEYNSNLESRAKDYERENARLKHELEVLQQQKILFMSCMSLHQPGHCECTELHEHMKTFHEQFAPISSQDDQGEQPDTPRTLMSHDGQ